MKRLLFVFLLVIQLLLFSHSLSLAYTQAIDSGLDFLAADQNPDGSWGGNESITDPFFGSSAVVETLSEIGSTTSEMYTAGVSWIGELPLETTAGLAHRLLALGQTGQDVDLLVSYFDPWDRAWGGHVDFGNNHLDTALAILALEQFDANDPQIQTIIGLAVTYLQDHQNSDGGWGFTSEDDSDVYVTAVVLSAVARNRNTQVQTCIENGVQFLLGHQHTDGGFGTGTDSTIYETALSFLALQESSADILTTALNVQNYLTGAQQPDGSWNNDAYETALAIRALFLIQPNLTATRADIAFSPSMPTAGQPVDITVTVHNAGYDMSGGFVVRIIDGDPGAGGVQIGSDLSVAGLGAEQSAAVTLNTSFSSSGARNLFVQIDPDNATSELNESDNSVSTRIWIATGPDLAVLSGDLQPATYTPQPGLPFTLTYRIRNLGESEVGPFNAALYDGDPSAGGTLLQQIGLSGLSGASSRTGSLGLNIDKQGSHTLYLVADADNQVTEVSKANNRTSVTVTVGGAGGGTDLVLGAGDIIITPSQPTVDQPVQIDVQVHNYGIEPVQSATLELFSGDPAGNGILLDSINFSLDPGQTYTMGTAWTVPAGNHVLYAIVDRANTVMEMDENNNMATAGIMTDMVDIVVSSADFKFTPQYPVAGDSVSLAVTAHNTGISPTGAFNLALYDGDPDNGGGLLQTFDIADLAGGAEQTEIYTFTAEAHTYRFYAVADQENQVVEFSEGNNSAVQTMTIKGAGETYGPDLVPLEITLSEDTETDPNTLTINGSASVRFQNKGDEKIDEAFTVLVYSDIDRDGKFTQGVDTSLGQVEYSQPLWPNGAFIVEVPLAGEVGFLGAPLSALIDSSDIIAEQVEDNNTITSGSGCEVRPTNPIQPVVKWSWRQPQMPYSIGLVMSPPAIVNITDDNKDGRIDENDIPDLVFNMIPDDYSKYIKYWGELRAFSGKDGSEIFKVFNDNTPINWQGGVAVGDIDHDGLPEIITDTRAVPNVGTTLIAYEHDGTLKWENSAQIMAWRSANPQYAVNVSEDSKPLIADLDGDGQVEIMAGGYPSTFNADGSVKAAPYYSQAAYAVRSTEIVADLDMDGIQEIILGNNVFNADATLKWRNNVTVYGYTAVGNLDDDPYPEIVIADGTRGPQYGLSLYVLEHDGQIKWGPIDLNVLEGLQNMRYEGQYPIIADFDGDGVVDIGIRNIYTYFIFDRNGQVKTRLELKKPSTTFDRETNNAPAVFDLNGDGRAEVMIKSGGYFQIFDGKDGTLLFEEPFGALTHPYQYQSAFVADIDGDNHAEVVVLGYDRTTNEIIRVYGSANNDWVNARRVWNQQSYHGTNINDDSTIPPHEAPSWLTHNTYRCQQPVGGFENPYLTPNLTASYLRVVQDQEGATLTVRVGNGGAAIVGPNAAVDFYLGEAETGILLGSTATTRPLAPGQFQDISFVYNGDINEGDLFTAVVDQAGEIGECNENDNSVSLGYSVPVGQADLKIGSEDIGLPAGPVAEGSLVSLSATVHNIGSADAANISVQLYNGNPDAGGQAIGAAQSIAALEAGGATPLVFTIDTLGLSGTTMCYVVVDGAQQIEEQSEDNNTAVFALQTAPPQQPNLTISAADIQIAPDDAQPGQVVTVSAAVHNRGATTSGIPVRFYLDDPAQGGSQFFGQSIFADLTHGASTTLQASLNTTNLSGQYQIFVVVDPLNIVAESNEQDNSANKVLFVQSAGLTAQAATDKGSYSSGEEVQINLNVADTSGQARQLAADVYILDARGNLLANLADSQGIDVGGNATVSRDYSWNTGQALNGSYTVVVEMFDGLLKVARATADFAIAADKSLAVKVACDKTSYEANQPVVINATAISQSANYVFEDLRAQVQILSPDQSQLYSSEQTIATLLPEALLRFTRTWNSAAHPAGEYAVVLRMYDDQTQLAAAQCSFAIKASTSSGQGLVGSLSVASDVVTQGEDLALTYQLENRGNADISALSMRILLVDPETQTVADTIEKRMDLPMAAVKAAQLTYSSAKLSPAMYLAILQVQAADFDAPRTVASTRFEVKPGALIKAELQPADPVNLLVWVNGNCRHGDEKHNDALVQSDYRHIEVKNDHHGRKAGLSGGCDHARRCVDIQLLKTLLDDRVNDYRLVFSPEEFAQEMQNPYYTDIMILGDHRSLPDKVRDELREKVFAGTGLISSMFQQPMMFKEEADWHHEKVSILGVYGHGNLPEGSRQLELVPSDLDVEGKLSVGDPIAAVKALETATVAGRLSGKAHGKSKGRSCGKPEDYPALVLNQYGQGKTVFTAFDLGLNLTPAAHDQLAALISGALRYIHRPASQIDLHPYELRAFILTLANPGAAVDLQIEQALPQGFQLYDPATGKWVASLPRTIEVSLGAGQSDTLIFYILAPDQAGSFEMTTRISSLVDGHPVPLPELSTPLDVQVDTRELIEETINALNGLNVSHRERWKVLKAVKLVQHLNTVDSSSRAHLKKNIHNLLKAAHYAAMIGNNDAAFIREQMDRLIAIYESRLYD